MDLLRTPDPVGILRQQQGDLLDQRRIGPDPRRLRRRGRLRRPCRHRPGQRGDLPPPLHGGQHRLPRRDLLSHPLDPLGEFLLLTPQPVQQLGVAEERGYRIRIVHDRQHRHTPPPSNGNPPSDHSFE
ncbi:hypothetical protein ACWGJW_22510 [Streptomyces nigrescens]